MTLDFVALRDYAYEYFRLINSCNEQIISIIRSSVLRVNKPQKKGGATIYVMMATIGMLDPPGVVEVSRQFAP